MRNDNICYPVALRNSTLGYVLIEDYTLPTKDQQKEILKYGLANSSATIIEMNTGRIGKVVIKDDVMYLKNNEGLIVVKPNYDYDLFNNKVHFSINKLNENSYA